MWQHTEAVYKKAPYQNATKQILAYLAHRADPRTHRMHLSHSRIANETGVSTKTVGRAMKTFIENGDIILIRKGSSNHLASEFAMGEMYRTTDTMSIVNDGTMDTMSIVDENEVPTMDMVGGVEGETIDMVSATMDTMSPQCINNAKSKNKSKSKSPPISPTPQKVKRQPAPGRRVGRQTNPALDLPGDLSALKRQWLKFQKHRMELNRPVRPTEAEELFDNFQEWGVERSAAAMKFTISKGWQGIQQDPDFGRGISGAPAGANGHTPPMSEAQAALAEARRRREARGAMT